MVRRCLILLFFALSGCISAQSPAYGSGSNVSTQNTYAYDASSRVQQVRYIGGPLDNTGGAYVSTTSYSSTSGSQVGSAFTKKLRKMKDIEDAKRQAEQGRERQRILHERERRIKEFLWNNEIPGVSDTRLLLKTTILDADKKLKSLERDLKLAGRAPSSDSTYIEILKKRNRVYANLQSLDAKIMDAIVSKSAGSAAKSVTVSTIEYDEITAATANLQTTAQQYKEDTEEILRTSKW